MEPLPPIKTPIEQRWREFRIQVLPVVFFILIVIALLLVWNTYIQPVSVVGEVEAIRANATSLSDGTLVSLNVQRFDRVAEGQVLGELRTSDPELQAASLAALAADLKVLQAQMDIDRTRSLNSYSTMKLDLLAERVALNLAKIHLEQAEKEFERHKTLYEEGIIPAGESIGTAPSGRDTIGFDVAKRDRDALRAEVEDRTRLISEWERELDRMESTGIGEVARHESIIDEAIMAKERELEQTLAPVQLISPLEGVVSAVYRRAGERVVAGEPVVTISATRADHIVGYLRQPVNQIPKPQDVVIVHKRGLPPLKAEGRVLEIGAQMEPITNALIFPDPTRLEMGLPILISMPPDLRDHLVPGQAVDLEIQYSEDGAAI